MKNAFFRYLLVLVVLALVPSLNFSADTSPALTAAPQGSAVQLSVEFWTPSAQAPQCNLAALDSTELPAFFVPGAAQAAGGCSPAACDTSCRNQGYDYGVCFGSTCICRFWFP